MPNFADVKTMTIPEGEVVKNTSESTVLWTKPSQSQSYRYTGSVSASYDDNLALNNSSLASTLSSVSDINVNEIYVTGGNDDSYTIYKIENGIVYYGDGSGTIEDGLIDVTIARHAGSGAISGIGLIAGSDEDGNSLYFDGNYTWKYKLI